MTTSTRGSIAGATLLLGAGRLEERRELARGALDPLASSLALELEPLLRDEPFIPREKARLTRRGGRCANDGLLLDFDPWSPHEHRCPRCGSVESGPEHYRMWIMWYQLWLAERAARAATLYALLGDARHAQLARNVLERYADLYDTFPNVDNVLGPTRPFFSTYLESIWLLQLCIALDLLEASGAPVDGDRVREKLVDPSRRLIAGYDESFSNRQVWNAAAQLAAARVMGDTGSAELMLEGPSGLIAQLRGGLLADGSWYEGENYHLFAHRGLWYGVTMAESAGASLPPELVGRFEEGFASPLAVALPDLTLPARRDSQYGISLRQWRFAEMCELGLARRDDARLMTLLRQLYDPQIAPGPTGRAVSSAESERNTPPVRLSRADLGWRSLLHARAQLPVLECLSSGSVLLESQGIAVLRREGGRVYVALDYGHSGGGHGHPDRLNLLLARGGHRWLDDPGTGSYVDPSLHWYRSTLAHNAPLVDGRSQRRAAGHLLAFEDRGAAGWVEGAALDIAEDVSLVRTVIAMPSYVLEVVWWDSSRTPTVDLPWHIEAELIGVAEWRAAVLDGSREPEDGFAFVTEAEHAHAGNGSARRLSASSGEATLLGWVDAPRAEWWRATAPGPPGTGDRCFVLARSRAANGRIASVWSWNEDVVEVAFEDASITVHLESGERHVHQRVEDGWHIDLHVGDASSSIDLGGLRTVREAELPRASPIPRFEPVSPVDCVVLEGLTLERTLEWSPTSCMEDASRPDVPGDAATSSARRPRALLLSDRHYRRSERSWTEAGSPSAAVTLAATTDEVIMLVDVRKRSLRFAPAGAVNELDNEHPDVNSDGLQVHVRPHASLRPGAAVGWLLVPEEGGKVRSRVASGSHTAPALRALWRLHDEGYAMAIALPRRWLAGEGNMFELDLLVNLMAPERERREGQLVLSGGRDEFVYLRGDRQPEDHLLPVRIRHA